MCCEYSDESLSINMRPNHLATLSCIGLLLEKLALCNQPRALELSVNASTFCGSSVVSIDKFMVIAAAKNSSKFIVNLPRNSLGIS